jgi:hypothetical protein
MLKKIKDVYSEKQTTLKGGSNKPPKVALMKAVFRLRMTPVSCLVITCSES